MSLLHNDIELCLTTPNGYGIPLGWGLLLPAHSCSQESNFILVVALYHFSFLRLTQPIPSEQMLVDSQLAYTNICTWAEI